jgi:MoxR-like ATPase
VFRRGHTIRPCPLRVCVGAANDLPQDETLAAFGDRFLLRVFVDPVPDPRLEDLLEGGWSLGGGQARLEAAPIAHVDALAAAAVAIDLAGVRPHLAHALRVLRAAGIALSDRRMVKVQRLVAAAAALEGRARAAESDLWPLVLAVPTREQQASAREALRDVLAASHNESLPAAAEEASLGPIARATRLAAAGRVVLAERPGDAADALADWRLRLEAVAREIDAGFAAADLPTDLAAVRAEIVSALGAGTRA